MEPIYSPKSSDTHADSLYPILSRKVKYYLIGKLFGPWPSQMLVSVSETTAFHFRGCVYHWINPVILMSGKQLYTTGWSKRSSIWAWAGTTRGALSRDADVVQTVAMWVAEMSVNWNHSTRKLTWPSITAHKCSCLREFYNFLSMLQISWGFAKW